MKRLLFSLLVAGLAGLAVLAGAGPAPAGETVHPWDFVMGRLPGVEAVPPLSLTGSPFLLPDDGPPANGARPGDSPNYPPIIDIQEGLAVRFAVDLSGVIAQTPCGGGPANDLVVFGCGVALLDPALFTDGAVFLGTRLPEPLPPGGLPAQTGLAILFAQPDGTSFTGPWPFGGATGALRFVPGGPVEKYLIGPDGLSFTGPFDPPLFVAGAPGDTWIWMVAPPSLVNPFTGIQFHAFLDNSPVSDTIPGNPGDTFTLAPFDPAAIGTLAPEVVTPPPVEEPADDPRDAPVEEPAEEEEEAAPPAAVATTDNGSDMGGALGTALVVAGLGAIIGGTILVRSGKGPCEELAEAMAAAANECARATEAARVAREQADRARQAEMAARAAYLPAGFPASGSSIDIDSESFTSRDMQLLDWDRRVHAPSASAAPGGQTATDISRRADEARQRLDELRAEDAEQMGEIDALNRAADEAEARALQAERHRDEVCSRAREAAADYRRRCPGNGVAATPGDGAAIVASPNGKAAVPAGWPELVAHEEAVQAEIATSMQALGEELARAYAGFGSIATSFATPYRRAVAGTTVLDELAAEAAIDIDRARTADLVLAFVQITNIAIRGIVGGVRLGIRGYQWFTKVPQVVDDAVRVADNAIVPMGRPLTGPLLSNPPGPLDGIAHADLYSWMIGRLAQQLGITVEQAMAKGGPMATKEGIVNLLKTELLAQRGFFVLADSVQMVLDRILFNARAASRGQLAAVSRADLRLFFSWVDQGILQHLPKAADPSTVYPHLANELGRILALFDDAELALLRAVAESPELRRVALEAPGVLGDAPDVVRLANGPTIGVLVDEVPGAVAGAAASGPSFGTRFLDVLGDVPPGATVGDLHGVTGVVRTIFGDTPIGIVGNVPPQVAVLPPGTDPVEVASARPLDHVLQADSGAWRLVLRDDTAAPQASLDSWRLETRDQDPTGTAGSLNGWRLEIRDDGAGVAASTLDSWRLEIVEEVAPWLPAAEPGWVAVIRPGGVGFAGWPASVVPSPDGVPIIDLGLPLPPIRGFESGVITMPTPEQIRLAEQMLDNARGLATGDGTVDGTAGLDDLGALGNGRAGGWDRLADVVIPTPSTYFLPFAPLDIGLLQAAVASGGDGAVLAETMGPIPANLLAGAVQAGPVLRSMADLGALDLQGLADQRASFQELYASLDGAGFRDLQGYVTQFLRDETRSHNFNLFGLDLQAGTTGAEFGWTFVKLLSEPVTTLTQFGYEQMADDLLGEYLAVHTDDFVAMIGSIDRAIGFLQGFGQAIGKHLDGLAPQATALQGVLDDLRTAGHDPDREAHVARKLADLGRSMASLRELQTLLGNIAGWLDSLVTVPNDPNSSEVTADRALGLLNPTSILRMMSAVLTLGDAIGRVLLVAPPPRELVLSPENEEIYERQKAAREAALREQERVDAMTDAEFEQWEQEQRAASEAQLEQIGSEYEGR